MRLPDDALAPAGGSDALADTHVPESADDPKAFLATLMSPSEIAAARMRQAVVPAGGRRESGATDALLDIGVPGRSALREAVKGNYPEAAGEAALTALPFGAGRLARAAPGAAKALAGGWAGSTVMSPEATGGGLVDSLPKEEQAAYADRLKQAAKIDSPKQRAAEIAKINAEITDKVSKRAEDARRLAGDKQADADWLEATKEMRGKLKPEQQSEITAAPNLLVRQDIFARFMRERAEANKTFAEKHAPELEAVRAGAAALGVALPAWQRLRQVGALERATADAERAWSAASRGRPTKADKAELAMRTNVLRDTANIPSGGSEFAKELGYGSLLPYTSATFIPNALEATGRFATGTPEDREVGYKALRNMADPAAVGASVGEGALATLGGQFLGRGLKNAPVAEARARGVLSTLTAEQQAKEAAAAKAAATRAANKAAKASGTPAAAAPKRRGKSVAPVVVPLAGAGAAGYPYADPLAPADPLSEAP